MCKKRKYTKMGALYSIVNAQHAKKSKKNKNDKIPVRAYHCKWCNLYPLSSHLMTVLALSPKYLAH